jgi:tetratricopeptide (TPR) repeat protein
MQVKKNNWQPDLFRLFLFIAFAIFKQNKRMRSFQTGLFLFFLIHQSFGQSHSVLSPEGQKSLLHCYQFPQSIESSHANSPKSPSIEYDYLQLYSLFITYQAYEQNFVNHAFNDGLTRFENSYKTDERFPLMVSTLLIQQSLLHWSNDDFADGIHSFYKAHRYFEKADSSKYKTDYAKLKSLFDIFLSQIPEQYQFWASLLGWHGDAANGFRILKENMTCEQAGTGSQHELLILYSYCLLKFGNTSQTEVKDLIRLSENHPSPILSFILGSLCIKKQMGDTGIEHLASIPGEFYTQFPLLHYLKGRLLLNRMDDACMTHFSTFQDTFTGESFQTDGLLRQAWWLHIQHLTSKRDSVLSKIMQQKRLPTSNDKQAQKEMTSLKNEPVDLLKARLLFDGGYWNQALIQLSGMDTTTIERYYMPEYYYRMGRINQALELPNAALEDYNEVIALCQDDKRYIGPYAAIEAAKIYLFQKDTTKAKQYLDLAVQLNTGDYKQDISRTISSMLND